MKATTIEEMICRRLLEKVIKKSKKMDINMIILGEVIDILVLDLFLYLLANDIIKL